MKRYEDLTITDDFMFCKLLQNNPDISQEIVELIIGEKIGGIVIGERQRPIEITPDGKGVRMDVYLKDNKDTVYNIEMQTTKTDNIPKRARYYQSMIDVELIERGALYSNLNTSYVIFFMLQDPFGEDAPIYTFENRCYEEPELVLGDGTKKIFVNANSVHDIMNQDVRALLDYMCGKEPTSELTNKIEKRIAQIKRNEHWKGEFMTLYEHYQIERSEGREEGRAEGLAEAVDRLIAKKQLDVAEACELLDISVEEYNKAHNNMKN